MERQTIRNLFEAYLQTSYLSSDDITKLLCLDGRFGTIFSRKIYDIRNNYLDNLGNDSEEHIEDYLNELMKILGYID